MSLIHRQKMTQKGLAAKRRNGRAGHGPVTTAGKARAVAARLLHGFYSSRQDEVMTALGEDPREFEELLKSLLQSFQPRPGLESQLVLRMARVLWRQRRADRVQDAAALRHVKTRTQTEQLALGPRLIRVRAIYQKLLDLSAALTNHEAPPTPSPLEAFLAYFKASDPELQNLCAALSAFLEPLRNASPQVPDASDGSGSSSKEGELAEARKKLEDALFDASCRYRNSLDWRVAEIDEISSPANVAALMAPAESRDDHLMQRMEDSWARQLWRLTRLLITLQNSGFGDADRD